MSTYQPYHQPGGDPAAPPSGYGQQPPVDYGYQTPPADYGYPSQPAGVMSPYGQSYQEPAPAYPAMAYPGQLYAARPEHPQASTVLALGIVSLFVAILGPVAWYMGNQAKRECATGRYAESGALNAGRIIGMIVSILMIIGVALVVGVMIPAFLAAAL